MCDFERKLNQLAPLETRVNILEQKLSTTSTANAEPIVMIMVYQVSIRLSLWFKTSWIWRPKWRILRARRNVIFHRVPEKTSDKVEERKESDLIFVTELDGVFNIKLQENVEWYWKKCSAWGVGLLLVTFKELEMRDTIIRNLNKILRNPIEKFRGVGISPDLHPKEREDIRKMIEEAKQVHIDNEFEDVENYRFRVVDKGVAKKW